MKMPPTQPPPPAPEQKVACIQFHIVNFKLGEAKFECRYFLDLQERLLNYKRHMILNKSHIQPSLYTQLIVWETQRPMYSK